jgi:NitT/TauT family transport system substrate-binding protein
LNESREQGWGELLFDGTDEAIWNKYIGGRVPVTAHFTLQSTIDKDPAKMQAFVIALWRATQWIKVHKPEEILRRHRALCRQHLACGESLGDHLAAEGRGL